MSIPEADAKEIFVEALRLTAPAERAAYLDSACGGNPALLQEVESLLRAYALAGDFLGQTRTQGPPAADFRIERAGAMIGRYKLLEQIGEGGFGVVYMAEQVEPVQRKVALKIIKPGMDSRQVIARFEAERQALALMDHPNIAKVLDGGATEAGRPYFVMELVRGIPITDYCDQKSLSTAERLHLFIQVCQAVQHAHQKGIIHRDLKPSNVMVTLYDGKPVPKVIDFGVAKALGQKLTQKTLFTAFHHMIGTPAYMSPEQAELSGLDVDTRSDVYSLGVLLYELLTGVTPFDAEMLGQAALDEMRRMIRETEPLKPSTRLQTLGEKLPDVAKRRHTDPATLSRTVRGDLDWIVMKCLEKDRTRRYATAASLEQDLRRHFANEPVEAGPPSQLYRLGKLFARNKLQVALGTAFVLCLIIALALALAAGKTQARLRKQSDSARAAAIQLKQQADLQRQRAETEATNALRMQLQAEFQSRNSEARRLLAEANRVVTSYPQRGLLLLVEALRAHLDHGEQPLLAIEQAFLSSLTNINGYCLGTAPEGMQCVRLSPNCRWVAAGGRGGDVLLWDLHSQNVRLSLRVLKHATNAVSALSFSPDSQWLASGDANGAVTLWRFGPDGAADPRDLVLHTNRINAVLFANQGCWLVTACEKGVVALWDVRAETAPPKPNVFVNEPGAITALASATKAHLLLLGDQTGNVRVLRLPSLAPAASTNIASHHSGKINAICLREGDHEFVTASDDGTARRWSLDIGGNVGFLATLKGHQGSVTAVAFDSNGGVITGGADGKVLLWNESTSNTNATALVCHHDSVTTIGFDPNGSVLTGAATGRPIAWYVPLASNAKPTAGSGRGPDAPAQANPRSDSVAIAYTAYERGRTQVEELKSAFVPEDWEACLYPLASLSAPAQPMNVHLVTAGGSFPPSTVGGVTSVTLSLNGERVVTSGYDGRVIVTQRKKVVILKGHEGPVTAVSMDPTGELIASSGWDGSVRIWASQELGSKLKSLKAAFEVTHRIRERLVQLSVGEPRAFDRASFAHELILLARDRIGRNMTAEEWHRFFPGRDYRKTFEEFLGL